MGVTIVVGGQYGSEGKGKVVSLESRRCASPLVVRCGGPNAGHTVLFNDTPLVLRQVPAGVVNPNALLLVAAGCVVDLSVLSREIRTLGLARERIVVDPRAVLVSTQDQETERSWTEAIGSTGSGNGAALIRRMQRCLGTVLAQGCEPLARLARVESVARLVHDHLDSDGDVIVEGTQGFGLSLLHGEYPYVTARDTSASAFASEVGIAPTQVDRVVMVLRTFPIRVGGDSGPMRDEISWDDVQRIGEAPEPVPEYTSVTNRLRRVANFDQDLAKRAARINRPTSLAVMGIDRLDYRNTGVTHVASLSERAARFLSQLAAELGVPIEWVGTGFLDEAFRVGN